MFSSETIKCNFENNISVSASFIRIENERIENSGKAFRDGSLLLEPVDFQVHKEETDKLMSSSSKLMIFLPRCIFHQMTL